MSSGLQLLYYGIAKRKDILCLSVAHKLIYFWSGGLPQRGPGAAGVPGGVRPPLPPHLHSTDGASRPGQPRSHMPGMDNHVVNQGNKDEKSGVNQAAQEVVDAPKKVC